MGTIGSIVVHCHEMKKNKQLESFFEPYVSINEYIPNCLPNSVLQMTRIRKTCI